MRISKEEAVVIANKEAARLKYEIAKMKIIVFGTNISLVLCHIIF